MKKDTVDKVRRLKDLISMYLGIGTLMFFLLLYAGPSAYGQDVQLQNQPVGGNIQVGGNAGNVQVEEGQGNAGYQQAGQQQMNDQGGEGQELTETIPPAVAIPDADWVFEVPIDVQGISPEVQKLWLNCSVWKTADEDSSIWYLGNNAKMLTLENGAYQGRVLIGVSKKDEYNYNQARRANRYSCQISLCQCPCQGTDCSARFSPTTNQSFLPAYRRMSPDRPYQVSVFGDLPQ